MEIFGVGVAETVILAGVSPKQIVCVAAATV